MVALDIASEKYDEQKAVLLRCAYPYGKSQTWLPNDLYKTGARLDSVGIKTDIVSLDLRKLLMIIMM